MSDEEFKSNIDWDRVKNILGHLKIWMEKNGYKLEDIERACAYSRSKYNVPRSGGTK